MSHDDRDTIRVQSPEPPAELMVELETEARALLTRGHSPALSAQMVCALRGLAEVDHVAMDVAERIRGRL